MPVKQVTAKADKFVQVAIEKNPHRREIFSWEPFNWKEIGRSSKIRRPFLAAQISEGKARGPPKEIINHNIT